MGSQYYHPETGGPPWRGHRRGLHRAGRSRGRDVVAERRHSLHRPVHPRLADGTGMDHRRLFPGLRRSAAARRGAGRPVRPPPRPAGRTGHFRRRLGDGDDGVRCQRADRPAYRDRARRRAGHARHLSTITGTFPPAKRTKAVSVWAAVAGGAAILGVLCAGALLEFFSWRSVFGLNVAIAAIAVIGTVLFVPESADRTAPRLDLGGAVLSVVGSGRLGLLGHPGPYRRVAVRSDAGRHRPRPGYPGWFYRLRAQAARPDAGPADVRSPCG